MQTKVNETTRWLDEFHRAYLECALWSSTDESDPSGGDPVDATFSIEDIDPGSMVATRETCQDFLIANLEDLRQYDERMRNEQWTGWSRAGHDFWLTRNGHGAGFWDRGLGDLGQRLTKAAEVYGATNIHVNFENPKAVYFE